MFDFEKVKEIVAGGLSDYIGRPVIQSNQNKKPPSYPYMSYTITTLVSENKGTYGEYADGVHRKPFNQIWSITSLSDDEGESVNNAIKAQEWLDHAGTVYLYDHGVVVESVGGITNRDNILTTEYEYRNGFDVVLSLMNEIESLALETGEIKTVDLGYGEIDKPMTAEEALEKLAKRLSGEVIE